MADRKSKNDFGKCGRTGIVVQAHLTSCRWRVTQKIGMANFNHLTSKFYTEMSKSKSIEKNVAAISTNPIKNDYVLENSNGGGNREQGYPDANGKMPLGMEFENFEKLPGRSIESSEHRRIFVVFRQRASL